MGSQSLGWLLGVRFLIGRSGSGKSAACAGEIRAETARDPLGGALLWVTPEQGTFTAERLLFAGGGAEGLGGGGGGRGSFRAQVLSFRRLASVIGREVGFLESERIQPLGDLARLVLLEEKVRQVRGELRTFAGVADRSGFLQKLDITLRELRQYGHTGESVRALAKLPETDALSAGKLIDLAVLLDAWNEALDAGTGESALWDLEKIMDHAARQMDRSRWIGGSSTTPSASPARIWVDGFSAMSALEVRLLIALAQRATEVTITLTADPDSRAIRELRCAPEELGLFARTERLYCRLMDAFGKAQVRVEGTHMLRTLHRFQGSSLRAVEAHLFEEHPGRVEAATLFAGDAVEVWECSDPETEVRAAAQSIRGFTIGGKGVGAALRYREIGVIVPDLEGYADAIGRIFTEHGIPHFIDRRRSVAHHPLVELLRSAVALRASRWDREEVLLYLKTGLAGVAAEEVAVVENYLIAHGITRTSWEVPWRWVVPNQKEEEREREAPEHARALLLRVNRVRAEVWKNLQAWTTEERGAAEGVTFVAGLRGLLERLAVPRQMKEWAERAQAAGDAELAQLHVQIARQIEELLVMLEGLLTGRERTLAEFAAILEGALATLTLGLIPPTVDQVLVSSVTRSRVPELRVAVVLGAVEGQFPKVGEEDAILSDVQRSIFNQGEEQRIGEGAERQLMEMPFFDYQALTRASERLIVSYPVADRRGRAVGKSRYVGRLKELLGEAVETKYFHAGCRTEIERIGTVEDLLSGVVTWTRRMLDRRAEMVEDGGSEPRMAQAYQWLTGVTAGAIAEAREWVWPAVRDREGPRLTEAMAQCFYPPGRDLRMSVSQLEKFASCPLQYFMHYTLGLRPRDMLEMDLLNLGTLYHRILERVYRRIIEKQAPVAMWPQCAEGELRRVVEEEVEKASAELHEELAEQTPSYEKVKARTKRLLGMVVEGERRRALLGELRPLDVEVNFGEGLERSPVAAAGARLRLPILRIEMPGGGAGGAGVSLNGKIDRVDGAGRRVAVVDYKSAKERKLELRMVYWGLTLQLPVYAVVMEMLAEREAVAALYVPLGLKRETVRQFAEAAEWGSDGFYQRQRPQGMVDAAGAEVLDHELVRVEKESITSEWYGIGFTQKGTVAKRGGMLEHGDYETVLRYVRWKIGAMGEELMRGEIGPAPYRTSQGAACVECEFSSLCPFDRASGVYRDVPAMKGEVAIERMRVAMEGGGHRGTEGAENAQREEV